MRNILKEMVIKGNLEKTGVAALIPVLALSVGLAACGGKKESGGMSGYFK